MHSVAAQTAADPDNPPRCAVTVVVASRNRRESVLATLARLRDLPERPAVIVVDDASGDGTAAAVEAAFPAAVRVLRATRHQGGAAARNRGVEAAATPYVAFADDDSWWAPGSLAAVESYFASYPRLALVAGRILVGPDERLDPTCRLMATSPLPGDGTPGPRILGFVACGAAVRRDAFLQVGGFPEPYNVGGEEQPLALALAAHGWDLAYLDDVVAHHHPAPRPPAADDRRRRTMARNDLWTAWRHRRLPSAARETRRILASVEPRARAAVLREALAGVPWVLAERQPLPRGVERQRLLLDE